MSVQSTISLHAWFAKLFERNHLSEPNQQPLYQYQITESEYLQLKGVLKQQGNQSGIGQKDKAWCAAFCIFCAEWFRRDYQGGWSWKNIWQELDFTVDANDRSYVLKKGLLEFWKRPLSQYSDERHSYLGSVFREGGLPYKLLRSNDNQFQEVFKRILRDYDKAKLMGRSPLELVAHHIQNLPEAFKQDTTIDLVAQIAERLVQLVDHYNLEQQSDPAKYLDKQTAGWRRLFPIPLDGKTGEEFLNGLLTSASSQRRTKVSEEHPIVCEHILREGTEVSFNAQIRLARLIPAALEKEKLSSGRVELYVAEGIRPVAIIGVGYIQFEDSGIIIQPRIRACEFNRVDPKQPLTLLIKQAGQTLLRIPIELSQLAIGELPIGLKETQGQWRVCGSASFSKKAQQILVILPEHTEVQDSEIDIHHDEIREGYRMLHFTGTLDVLIEADQYRISTNSIASFENQVFIEGKILSYPTNTGQPIYLGMPSIRCVDANALVYVSGERYKGENSALTFGVQTVKLKSPEGLTLFHRRLAVLPSDFSVDLKPGVKPNEGAIYLASARNFVAGIETQEKLSIKQVNIESGKRIDLVAQELPPPNIFLSVLPNLEANPVNIKLPFPAQGALVFDANGKPLERELVVEDLLGSRLQLFPRLNGRANYVVELLADKKAQNACFEWQYEVQDKPTEISLYELRRFVRELLAITPDDLDARVRLRISGDCKTQTHVLRRYRCIVESNDIGIKISSSKNNVTAKPVVINLIDPKESPRPLLARRSEGVCTGYFENSVVPDSPSLIVPAKNSEQSFRAKFLPGKSIPKTDTEPTSLYRAVELFHPLENPNVIHSVLGLMASDFNHSGWQYLIDLFERYSYLPLSTFEAWKALSKHNQALCMLAFRLEGAAILMERLQDEFNVFWELISLSAWRLAHKKYRQHIESIGLPGEVLSGFENTKLNQISEFVPAFESDCRNLIISSYKYTAPVSKQQMNIVVQSVLYQNLRTQRDSSNWPEKLSKKMEKWYLDLEEKPLDLNIEVHFHKAVVFFPIFAAAVAAEHLSTKEFAEQNRINIFELRKLLQFDQHWFSIVYKYCLSYFESRE